MHYYKSIIQYDGTGYAGFQFQKDAPTIQNDFNCAIKKIIKGKVTTMGGSRTDAGVHALKQIVKITTEFPIDGATFVLQLNSVLGAQIRCLAIDVCDWNFRPTMVPLFKEYRYYFTNTAAAQKSGQRFISNFPYELNLDFMQICIKKILGEHNFCNFASQGSNVQNTIRTIFDCELTKLKVSQIQMNSKLFPFPIEVESCYQLKIKGNGFLKQMIRHLVSAIWMVGCGKLTIREFEFLLSGAELKKRPWKVAPPNGLFLYDFKLTT
jgi:tRNA pseudouridine38-40 synthase